MKLTRHINQKIHVLNAAKKIKISRCECYMYVDLDPVYFYMLETTFNQHTNSNNNKFHS